MRTSSLVELVLTHLRNSGADTFSRLLKVKRQTSTRLKTSSSAPRVMTFLLLSQTTRYIKRVLLMSAYHGNGADIAAAADAIFLEVAHSNVHIVGTTVIKLTIAGTNFAAAIGTAVNGSNIVATEGIATIFHDLPTAKLSSALSLVVPTPSIALLPSQRQLQLVSRPASTQTSQR